MRGSWMAVCVVVLACGDDSGRDGGPALTLGEQTSGPSASSSTTSPSGEDPTTTTATTVATIGGDATSGTAGSDGSGDDAATGGLVAMCPPQGAMSCAPGPGEDLCDKIESCFAGQVATAVSETIMEHPEWFEETELGTMVLDVDNYVNTVVGKMVTVGRCAIRDPNDGQGWEVAVKHNNDFAESFRLVRSDGTARTGTGSYTATCTPAWF